MVHYVSINYDYSIEEVLEMYKRLDDLINQDCSFEDILTKKVEEGKIVFSGSHSELLH